MVTCAGTGARTCEDEVHQLYTNASQALPITKQLRLYTGQRALSTSSSAGTVTLRNLKRYSIKIKVPVLSLFVA